LFSDLLDYQPVALSEMPLNYLKHGNARVLYMLKTYTLKQLDVFRREIVDEYKRNPKQAMLNAAKLSGMFVAMGMATDVIRDFLSGRKIRMDDLVVDNLMKLTGLTKYIIWQAREEGPVAAAIKMVTPPVQFLESFFVKDLKNLTSGKIDSIEKIKDLEVFKSVPLVGKAYYWWLGGGREREEKKRIAVPYDRYDKMAKDLRSNEYEKMSRFASEFKKLEKDERTEFYNSMAKLYDMKVSAVRDLVKGKEDENGEYKGGVLNRVKGYSDILNAREERIKTEYSNGKLTQEKYKEKLKKVEKDRKAYFKYKKNR
jgi:hypothetical protein